MAHNFTFVFGRDRWGSSPSTNLIHDVWYGQTDVFLMIWLLGIGVRGIVILFIGGFLMNALTFIVGSPFPLYLFVALLVPEEIWYLVGLWRSAVYQGGGWGTTVKILYFVWLPLELALFCKLFTDAVPLGFWLKWMGSLGS